MIFITTGTVDIPFKRLVDKSIEIFWNKEEKVIIQAGNYKTKSTSKNIDLIKQLPFNETLKLYKNADLIISACGEVSTLLILQYSKNMPIFVPRGKKYGEHVDNQQIKIARILKDKALANIVYNPKNLEKAVIRRVKNPKAQRRKRTLFAKTSTSKTLISNLTKLTNRL
jgi:UDP-N-acetylglucosamine transferase subunit ALG13